jgi:hypothetical protein
MFMVLYVGDSHTVGSFGHELDRLLRTENAEVATYGSCGSSPEWWSTGHPTNCGYFDHVLGARSRQLPGGLTPLLDDLLSRLKPETTVIELGANQVGNAPASVRADAAAMMKKVRDSGSKCIWVGPPKGRKFDPVKFAETYTALQAAARDEGCSFIDSRPWLEYPATGGDGIHYDSLGPSGSAMARGWAHRAFEAIRNSAHGI